MEVLPDRVTGRRRRANVAGGRQHGHRVLVSPEEEARLVVLAEAQYITVPRLLVESALNGVETPTQRQHAMADLFGLERHLAVVSAGLERMANGEAAAVLTDVRAAVTRIEAAIDGLAAT